MFFSYFFFQDEMKIEKLLTSGGNISENELISYIFIKQFILGKVYGLESGIDLKLAA